LTFRIPFIELKIIYTFRKLREEKVGYSSPDIQEEQYDWCARALGISAEKVRSVIEFWMLKYPLQHLYKTRYQYLDHFFIKLKDQKKQIAIFSDFPVEQKLQALKLQADRTFCSTDKQIAQLKPGTKGLTQICQAFQCPIEKAIFFGDRIDTDGESARLTGMDFLWVDVQKARKGEFYSYLLNQISHENGK
jgi:FMN phosphatase YigB (HAD superfamily)